MAEHPCIGLDPKMLLDKPVVTRIAVEFVIVLLGNGWNIIASFPRLAHEDIHASLCHAYDIKKVFSGAAA